MGPLGGGFGNGGWETNTLVSDTTTVICLDDYHANDRGGRKITGTHAHADRHTLLSGRQSKTALQGDQMISDIPRLC